MTCLRWHKPPRIVNGWSKLGLKACSSKILSSYHMRSPFFGPNLGTSNFSFLLSTSVFTFQPWALSPLESQAKLDDVHQGVIFSKEIFCCFKKLYRDSCGSCWFGFPLLGLSRMDGCQRHLWAPSLCVPVLTHDQALDLGLAWAFRRWWAWREFGDGLGLLGYQKGRKLTRKDLPADHKRIEISHVPSYLVCSQQREWHLVRLLPRKLVRTTLSWVILEEECNEEEAPETCPKAILVALTRRVPSLAGNIPGKQHPWTHGWFSMNSIRP